MLKKQSDKNWWRGAGIYQVYLRSFRDANGDGIGDFKGVVEKLGYIKSLGVDAIWLSPFYRSPMKDFGYDVTDYKSVDPIFGTLEDFDDLVEQAHQIGLKIIIDAVFSHTSDQHAWFIESRESRDNGKADWYVWADPKMDNTLPNNWQSVFGGNAWHWDPKRNQYYFHNFLTSQPDLNVHNPEVQDALLDVLRFWLDRGVDGFRFDTVNFYFHDKLLRDNPPVDEKTKIHTGFAGSDYAKQRHLYDKSQPENLGFLMRIRDLLEQYDSITTVGEIGDDEISLELMSQYTSDSNKLHMAYTFDLLSHAFSSEYISEVVDNFEHTVTDGWPCWSVGNHDVARVVTRWGKDRDSAAFAKIIASMLLSLKGSYCIYQGEELGLNDVTVPFEKIQDPFGIHFWPDFKGRDGCRTPFPWTDDMPGAGFTDSDNPWLPLAKEHIQHAVNVQDSDPNSVLNHYRNIIQWRNNHPILKDGKIEVIKNIAKGLVCLRRHTNENSMICVFNLTDTQKTADWSFEPVKFIVDDLPHAGTIEDNKMHLPAYSALFVYTNV